MERRIKELRRAKEKLEAEVKRRNAALKSKVAELQTWNRMAMEREMKIIELKRDVEELRKKLAKVSQPKKLKT